MLAMMNWHKATMAALLLVPGLTARAQTAEPEPLPPAATAEAPEVSLTPAQRLEQLLADLPEAEGPDAQLLQRRITDLWAQSGSDSMDYLLIRGRDALESEAFDTALDHLTTLVDLAPDFVEAWNLRATVYFMQEDYWSSVADVQKVLEIEPRHFGALSGLGIMLERIGAEASALVAFRAAIAVNPHLENVAAAIERLAPKVDGRDI